MPRVRALLTALLLLLAVSPAEAQEARELRLRVVSFNVWGLPWGISSDREARAAAIGPAIAELKPDLVALQEVWVPEDGEVIAKALAAVGLVHHQHESDGLLGSGLLVASRYPLKSVRFTQFDLGGKPHKFYNGDYYARKGVLVARVETPAGSVVFADTHLHARYGSQEYEPLQVTQALQAIQALGNHGEAPPERPDDPARPPLILCGDLNNTREAVPFRLLCAGTGLEPPPADLRIDWVLTRHGGGLTVKVTKVQPEALTEEVLLPDGGSARLSDHPAVVADLRLRRGPPPRWNPKQAQARWSAVAAEAAHLVEPERLQSQADGAVMLRRVILFMVLAAGLFGVGRLWSKRNKKPGKVGCALALLALLFLHLATWAAYFAAFFEPWYQSGLSAALVRLGTQ